MKKVFPNTDVNLKSVSLKNFLIISLLPTYLGEFSWFVVSHPSRYCSYTYLHIHVEVRETSFITRTHRYVWRKGFSLIFLVTTARVTKKKNTVWFTVKITSGQLFDWKELSCGHPGWALKYVLSHTLPLPHPSYSVIGSLPSWKMSSSGFSSVLTSQAWNKGSCLSAPTHVLPSSRKQ